MLILNTNARFELDFVLTTIYKKTDLFIEENPGEYSSDNEKKKIRFFLVFHQYKFNKTRTNHSHSRNIYNSTVSDQIYDHFQ